MKVVYLSSTELGKEMFAYMQTLDPEVVYVSLENEKISNYSSLDYDLGISFLYTHKIPASEFRRNKVWVNFHPGALPDFPGRNLCYHAIMEKASHFGATIHFMDENFDSGQIIEVRKFKIQPHHTAGDLNDLARKLLSELFKEYIPTLIKGQNVPSQPQQPHTRYFKQSVINEEIKVSAEDALRIRALTVAPRFYPYILIEGRKFFIIPEQDAE